MLLDTEIHAENISDEWAIRSENWLSATRRMQPRRRLRDRRTTPLILCGHGVSLRIENDALVIRDGFTHYPQEQAAYRYFRGDLTLPPRIILLDGSGTLSFDVLSWLGEQGVALARIKWNGDVAVVAGGSGYAADAQKVEWQRLTRADESKRLAFAADLIRRKLIASLETLETCIQPSKARDNAVTRAKITIDRFACETFPTVGAINGVEGACAGTYFIAWKALPIKWTGTGRKQVPEHWLSFGSRSTLLSRKISTNGRASHPVNAMLNYAYAVRLTQLQIEAVSQGYDPMFGIMHNAAPGSPAYILDLIEPERPKVDAAILHFVSQRSFTATDFVIRKDGVCRLSPQLARTVASLISVDALGQPGLRPRGNP